MTSRNAIMKLSKQTLFRSYSTVSTPFNFPKRIQKDKDDLNQKINDEAAMTEEMLQKMKRIDDLKKRLGNLNIKGNQSSNISKSSLLKNPFVVHEDDYILPPLPKSLEQIYHNPVTGMQLSTQEYLSKKEEIIAKSLQDKKENIIPEEKFIPMTAAEQKWYRIYVSRKIASDDHMKLIQQVRAERDLALKQKQLFYTKEGVRTADPEIIKKLPEDKDSLLKLQKSFEIIYENLTYLSADLQQEILKYDPRNKDAPQPKDGVFVHRIISRFSESVRDALDSTIIPQNEYDNIISFYQTKEEEIAKDAVIYAQKSNFHDFMKEIIMWRPERRKQFVRSIVKEIDDVPLARRIKTCFMNWRLWKRFVKSQFSKESAIRDKFMKLHEIAWKKDLETRVQWQLEHEKEFRNLITQWKMIQRNDDITGDEIMNKLVEEDDNDPYRYELFSKYFYEGDHGWVEKRLFSPKNVELDNVASIDPLQYQDSRYELSKQYGIANAPFLQQQRQLMQLASGDAPFGSDSVSGTFKPPVANPNLPPVDIPEDHEPIVTSDNKYITLNKLTRQTPYLALRNNPLTKHQFDFPFEETRLSWKRVSVQRSQGKEINHNCQILIGSERGFVGVGFGRASDPRKAIDKARRDAFANIRSFDVDTKNPSGVVTTRIRSKYRASILVLTPSRHEYVAAHPILRKICRYLGITHCSIKLYGSKHMYSVLPNFFKAIEMLKTEEFTRTGRGRMGPQRSERFFTNYLEKAHDRTVYGNSHLNISE